MVRASSRLLLLLNNPKSHLQRRPFATFRVARHQPPSFSLANTTLNAATNHLLHISRTISLTPIKFSQNFSSRATDNIWQDYNHISTNDYQASLSHPWPEWSRFLESLSIAGYFNWISNIEDEFVANQNLSMEFVAAANSCIAFARDRPDILGLLPRKDIEVLIDDGYPFLFKSAHNTERIMRSFLQAEGSNEARSVDLMKYILSYASSPIIYPERNIKEAIESSVRSLLQEMVNLSCRGQSSEQYQTTRRDEQISRNFGPNITMKKGDWICPKCNFMNFARNTKCLECEELRPADYSRYTTTIERGQNDRNAPSPITMATNSGYVMGRQGQGIDKEEKVASWFKKVKELHKATDPNTSITHVDNKNTEIPFSPKRQHPMNQESSSSFVPFVPFPPDYFAKKDNNTVDKNIVQETETRTGNLDSRSSVGQQSLSNGDTNTVSSGNQSSKPEPLNVRSVGTGKSLEGSAVTESDPLDMSEEAKAERWFRRVAQIKDISELSQIPDEDFPSIMPMRKGVNRFVVSKRKTPLERRLTSPEYRKNLRVMSSERKREGDDDN